ncbi:MGH1-like glycoside hydrolase domain-containing protein [Haloferacaceae archaeon DSL9]
MIPDPCALALGDGRFAVVGPRGDVRGEYGETGLYAEDTQFLDRFALDVAHDGTADWEVIGQRADPDGVTTMLVSTARGSGRGSDRPIGVEKRVEPTARGFDVTVAVHNYVHAATDARVDVVARGSFRHLFECPAFFSARRTPDRDRSAASTAGRVTFAAECPDEITREATVTVDGAETATTTDGFGTLSVPVSLGPGETRRLRVAVTLSPLRSPASVRPDLRVSGHPIFETARETIDALVLPEGVPAAGAPRFVAPFGRDALVVGFQTLPFDPRFAARILSYFAAQRGTTPDATTLEAPGKIPHERRHGDLPAIGESIRTPYFGTVDATPLFVALVAAWSQWAGLDSLPDVLYDAAVDGLGWIRSSVDGDGLLRYAGHDHEYGLTHLGWKDSADALSHPDGTRPTGEVALAEVQGYVYRAYDEFEPLARHRDDDALAADLDERADALRTAFDDAFWLSDEQCYGIALDDNGTVPSVASNQGHALWCGLVPESRADDVVDRLVADDMLTDAGIRTVASSHPISDPLSYHRGSVWSHDTSLATLGFARYGRRDAVATVAERGLRALDVGTHSSAVSWGFPELQVGVESETIETGAIRHPDSCEPAAWSAGAAFGFARAMLGLEAHDGDVSVSPALADSVESPRARIRAAGTDYDIHATDTGATVTPTLDAEVATHG